MNTAHTPIDIYSLLDSATKVDTTTGTNGYPRHLRVAYTADTMAELRDLKEAAEAAGHQVDVIRLHRRDGWALWERGSWSGLDDDEWMGIGEDTAIVMEANDDPEAVAFAWITGGEPSEADSLDDLRDILRSIERLAEQLPEDLKEGQKAHVFINDYNRVKYTVQTGQNGYAYDTHQYCTALEITEREEEEDSDDEA